MIKIIHRISEKKPSKKRVLEKISIDIPFEEKTAPKAKKSKKK